MGVVPTPVNLQNVQSTMLEGMKLKITFEKEASNGEIDLHLFEQLKSINLRDKKKKLRIPKYRKEK